MASVNKVILIGNLGQAPDVRITNSGIKVAEISIATSSYFNRDNERVEKTTWHTVTLWNSLLKLLSSTPARDRAFTSKVDLKLINGRIKTAKTVTQQKSSPRASSSWINDADR